jgi:hypothetical protein
MGTEDVGQQTSGMDSETKKSAKDFHLKEYDALRHAQDTLDGRLVTIIQYPLLFSGAIYSFLLIHTPNSIIDRAAACGPASAPLHPAPSL